MIHVVIRMMYIHDAVNMSLAYELSFPSRLVSSMIRGKIWRQDYSTSSILLLEPA